MPAVFRVISDRHPADALAGLVIEIDKLEVRRRNVTLAQLRRL
jgi:hypothetical protein